MFEFAIFHGNSVVGCFEKERDHPDPSCFHYGTKMVPLLGRQTKRAHPHFHHAGPTDPDSGRL